LKEELLVEKTKEENMPRGKASRDSGRDKDVVRDVREKEPAHDQEAIREKEPSQEKESSREREFSREKESPRVKEFSREKESLRENETAPRDRDPSPREIRDARGGREPREAREAREQREGRDVREARELREARDPRDLREARDPREARDSREATERLEKRDLREAPERPEKRDPREEKERPEKRDLREEKERPEKRDLREEKERPEKRDLREEKEELLKALKMLAPGTPLREGLESILRANMGALIVLGDSPELLNLVEGGFRVDIPFTPPYIYELSKMDGAIIMSEDAQRILYANTQLIPDPTIPSEETGIRHRTAHRFSCQTGAIVIAISHRRGVISLYKGSQRYVLREIGVILSKANQAIQTLERYKHVLDKALSNLTALEFEELVTVFDVAKVVQRGEMVLRIVRELEGYIVELGVEGRLVTMQAEELVANVEEEIFHVIQDYQAASDRHAAEIMQYLSNCSSEELLELSNLSRALGYGAAAGILDLAVFPRGYRILHKIPKLPTLIIENLIQTFGRLQEIARASIEELDAVEGIGEARARAIKNGMRRLQEQVMLDRYL
jgi:diadenylate cyclase